MSLDPDVPQHLSIPLRIVDGHAACVEQDTQAEIDTNVLVAISYPARWLRHDPTFGARPVPFRQNGTDLDALRDKVREVEDRADNLAIDRVIVGLREQITIDPTPTT